MKKQHKVYVLNNLYFNGEAVGKRVDFEGFGVYDVSLADFNLIIEDYYSPNSLNLDRQQQNLILQERGNQLIPEDNSHADEITYTKFMRKAGHPELENTDTDLKTLYNKYNKLCFNNELPDIVSVEWSSRMTSAAGICSFNYSKWGRLTRTIKLSTHYHEKYPEEIVDTLVHEMIHVLHPEEGHGRKFKATMNELNRKFGFNLSVYTDNMAKVNYEYTCKRCGYVYERARRLNTNTSKCGGGCGGELQLTGGLKAYEPPKPTKAHHYMCTRCNATYERPRKVNLSNARCGVKNCHGELRYDGYTED